jgi:hypothetical protein
MTARRLPDLTRMKVRLLAALGGCVLFIVACSSSSSGTGPDDGGPTSDGGTCGTAACGAGELCCRTDPCSSAMGCTQPFMGECPPLAGYACDAGAPNDGSADARNDASAD